MEIKIPRVLIGFSLICIMITLDLLKKKENYYQFIVLKQTYIKLKKNMQLHQNASVSSLDWPVLIKIWNQKAIEFHCQIQQIHTNHPGLAAHFFYLKMNGRFFDLIAWLREVQKCIPQLSWTKIVMTTDKNHQLIMIVEGVQDV